MVDNLDCLICGDERTKFKRLEDKDGETLYECPNCGTYIVDRVAQYSLIEDLVSDYKYGKEYDDLPKLKTTLFYYLKVKKNRWAEEPIIYITCGEKDSIDKNSIDLDTIYKLVPKTFSERIDMVMNLLNIYIKNIGEQFNIGKRPPIFILSSTKDEKDGICKLLKELKYINDDNGNITFTSKGWEKIDSLQRNRKSQIAFIAMSFKQGDDIIKDAEAAIKIAIHNAGYEPIIIKDKEHNHPIPQEIEYEIKRAAFVVADLTLQNNGAYYEAGMAKGLGKEVIFTCNKNDFEHIHFDTKQINTIIWSDKDEFIDDLYNRIKFTVGEYSKMN